MFNGYKPRKLYFAKKQIVDEHPLASEEIINENENLRTLVKEVESWEKNSVQSKVIVLTIKQIKQLIQYIPYNFYKTNMENFYLLFDLVKNDEYANILFYHWQCAENSKLFNKFFIEQINKGTFNNVLNEKKIIPSLLIEALNGDDVSGKVCQLILEEHPYSLLESQFKSHKLNTSSRLYNDCLITYFLYCSKEGYLNVKKDEIQKSVGQYTHERTKIFIINFVNKLQIAQMNNFKDLAELLTRVTGNYDEPKFSLFFKDVDYDVVDRYKSWLIALEIDDFFGKDERSQFWKRYKYINIKGNRDSNCILMETKRHMVVEFKGKGQGPLYIFDKDTFNEKMLIIHIRKKESEIKEIFNCYQYEPFCFRKEHRGFWENVIIDYIESNNITTLYEGYTNNSYKNRLLY